MLTKSAPLRDQFKRIAATSARALAIATSVALYASCMSARAGDITEAPSASAALPTQTGASILTASAGHSSPSTLRKLQDFSGRASELVMHAFGLLGIRYRMGGSTPENGLDCSGLVRYVFKQAWGQDLPRTAVELSQVGETVQPQELQPGDLVFYNTMRRGFSHVGIYLGDNKFIHSPSAGGQVRIESMDISYWRERFSGARRVAEPLQH